VAMPRNTSAPSTPTKAVGRRPAAGPTRRKPAPRRKDLPWGWISTVAVIVIAGGLLIGYAATRPPASAIAGVLSYPNLARNHVTGTVRYPQTPPAGGNHSAVPLTCGVYDQPVPNENAVHSLEHGALWITYRPGLPAGQLSRLKDVVGGNPYRLLSPYSGLPAPVVATAWGKQLPLNSASDPRLAKFAQVYTQGPTDQEPGAACQGTATPTG